MLPGVLHSTDFCLPSASESAVIPGVPEPFRWDDERIVFDDPRFTWDGFWPETEPSTPALPANLPPLPMTPISHTIAELVARVGKTRSVQTQIAGTWLWPLKTVEEWEVDAAAIDESVEGSVAQIATEAHTRAEGARGVLDARIAAIHAQTLSVVGVMRVRAVRDPEATAVVEELSARGDSRKAIEEEGAAVLSAWKLEFGAEAFTPAPGVTYAGFRALFYGLAANPAATPPVTAVPSLRELKDAYSDAATIDRRESGRLNKKLALIERDCVDWYAEATKVFVAGTEIGDLIRSEVPVTTGGEPATPTPTPTPTPPTP